MIGSLFRSNTSIARTMSRHTLRVNVWSLNALKGIHAPTNTNAAMLNSRSMTELKTDSSVWRLKNPSHANVVPHAKEANRSSTPSNVHVPTVNMASDTY